MKDTIKQLIPPPVLNEVLLQFPFLYASSLVNYESNFQKTATRDELLAQLGSTFDVPGDVIECGSSRCGTSVIMARFLRSKNVQKKILACDSFEGFDKHELQREYEAGLTTTRSGAFTSTSYEYVKRKIAALGVDDTVVPVKGFFQETLPSLRGPFSFALIDCDLRDSLVYAAETLWPRMSSGGLVLFDDYLEAEYKGAKLGVEAFVEQHPEITSHGLLTHFYYVRCP